MEYEHPESTTFRKYELLLEAHANLVNVNFTIVESVV